MKTAQILGPVSRNAGGLLEVVAGLSKALALLPGMDVSAIGVYDEHVEEDRVRWAPCRLLTVPISVLSPRKLMYAPGMVDCIQTEGPLVSHCHGLWTYNCWATLTWARRTRRPYMVSPHGMLDAVDLAKSRFVKFIATKLYVGRLLHGAPCLRALCEAEVQSMRTFGLRNPICLIPNGVDFKPVVGVAAPWKDRLPRGAKILLYIGRIHPKKGISFLLDGWARARKESAASSDWHLVIAGWEQYGHEGQLKAQSKALGLDANVHFIGPQFGNGKAAAFANADALVLPSTSEGLPTVVLEAWTSGLPVVITPQCNIPEGVKAGAALEIATEAGDIARGLSTLFSMTADQRREMGDKGRQLVGDKFAWPRIATEMKRVYDWMLGGGTPPDCVRRN